MLGWIALTILPSLISSVLFHVLPKSVVISKCTFHPSFSVLDGQINFPSTKTGLFFIGPRKPAGNASLALHVFPCPTLSFRRALSFDRIIQPVHPPTLGPIL